MRKDGFDPVRLLEERLPVDVVEQAQRADRPLDADSRIERNRSPHADTRCSWAVVGAGNGDVQLFEEVEMAQDRVRSIVGNAHSSAIVSGDTS